MSTVADTLVRTLTEVSIRVSVLTALIALILVVTRVRAVGARHAAWTALLLAMILMPALPYALPAIEITAPVAVIDLGREAPEHLSTPDSTDQAPREAEHPVATGDEGPQSAAASRPSEQAPAHTRGGVPFNSAAIRRRSPDDD